VTLTKEQVRDNLQGCCILIVEDSVDLAERIARLLKPYCGVDPVLVHSMEKAKDIVKSSTVRFSLAIVDIMLPITDDDFKQMREHEETLEEVRQVIRESVSRSDDAANQDLIEARANRAAALRQINRLIDTRAGIELVAAWQPILAEQDHQLPILYLTAVGNDSAVREGLSVAGEYADWAVKPVPARDIIDRCVRLVRAAGSAGQ
jgi:DNA-binding response OmpR family regulator